MANLSPRKSTVTIATAAAVSFVLYRIVIWRARSRARKTVDRVAELVQHGKPLIDIHDGHLQNRILMRAIRRAKKWMNLSTKTALPMIGQVGGASIHKRPVLTLSPDYVLKPVLTDHRGLREIAFYEAMEAVSKTPSSQAYSNYLRRGSSQKSGFMILNQIREVIDTLALACAMLVQDEVVVASEAAMKVAWRTVKREAEHLHTLNKYTPPYYGTVGLDAPSPDFPFGVSDETYLMFRDMTANFSRPCVMDLKMGTTTYESDAPVPKRRKEYGKYTQQSEFGFRIVGMRVYNPTSELADERGYEFYGKQYGRDLKTKDQVKQALKTFFGAGLGRSDSCETVASRGDGDGKENEGGVEQEEVRMKSVSNTLVDLRMIRRWFQENKSLLFCASSLLLVYEGNPSCETPDVTSLKMIDFGRVRRNHPEGDPGYLHGLETLKELLIDIIQDEEKRLGVCARTNKVNNT
eukprot:CAMPEP_0172442932 /NCGR_PEP_ID=MMETSP1065-20121228/3271_1 /TAXON_ID=265537 /ORGANISM="Amphiprora paludosa, Strain CCMP125" /LENGTH=463 /DNA_ID=CAMNT_0013192979 /DNA_START=8 /DNA_END=1399 /DNA_ORIENTATION=+